MSERKKGSTSVSLLFRLTDVTTGAAATGLDVTAMKLQYERPGEAAGTATSLTLLAALTTGWTSYGARQVDATNSPGVYRVDCPDLAFATGADEVTLTVNGAAVQPATRLIDLTAFDARDGVRGGLTSLPNAAAGANAGLPVLSVSGTTLGYTVTTVTAVNGLAANSVNASALATDAVTEILTALVATDLSGGQVVSSVGYYLKLASNLDATVSSRLPTTSYAAAPSAAAIRTEIDTNSTKLDAAVSSRSTLTAAAVRDVDNTAPAAGSLGAKVNSAANAGDPWVASLPGSYASGTAGNIVGNRLDTPVSTRSTFSGGAVSSVTVPVTVGTVTDKTGYSLAATGLDAISVADPGAPASHTTFAKMLVAVYRSLWRKQTMTSSQVKRYGDDGTTVRATAPVSDDGTTQSIGDFS